jgi:hypothetical protein
MGEVVEVRALGVVELQDPDQGLQDAVGHPGGVAPLQAREVADADAGQQRHLLAAEPGHAPVPAVGGKAGLLR